MSGFDEALLRQKRGQVNGLDVFCRLHAQISVFPEPSFKIVGASDVISVVSAPQYVDSAFLHS